MSKLHPGDSLGKSVSCADSQSDSDVEGDESDDRDSDNDSDGGGSDHDHTASASDSEREQKNSGLSEYERLRLERIARNNARLAQLFPEDTNELKRKSKKTPNKPRQSLPEGPRRQLPEREKRAVFNDLPLTSAKKEKKAAEEKNLDACYECQKEDGELLNCDFCRKQFHAKCHTPPVSPNDDEFKCLYCEASGKYRRLACGQCSGCLREMDCMTCVYCVNKYSRGTGQRKKCLFRKCQSWGKNKSEIDSSNMEGGEEEDHHDADCFICQNGGDMVCCDGCTRVYHSDCHKPKIYDLPEGDWYCMECSRSRRDEKEKSEKIRKYTGSLIADIGHRELKCTVRFPKITCISCDEMEATGAFKAPDWVTCRTCDDSYHLKCLDPPLEYRPNTWRCLICKEKKAKAKVKVKGIKEDGGKKKESKPLFDGEHDDDCFMCYNGGDLVCCDYCEKSYHLACHLPPLVKIPNGNWKCQECSAVEYSRKMRCGECKACKGDDCGTCDACLDKPKFGGLNRMKQVCVKRKCPYLRFAPPAKANPKDLSKKEYKELKLKFASGSPLRSSKKRTRDSIEGGNADCTPMQDGNSKRKRGRPRKSQKETAFSATSESATEDAPINPQDRKLDDQPPGEEKPMIAVKSSSTPEEIKNDSDDEISAVISFIKSRPLTTDDHNGKKIRQIVIKALQNPHNSKTQDLACEALRKLATDANHVTKIVYFGGLRMASKAMKDHPDKTILQAEASALLAQLAWVDPPCVDAIISEGVHHLVLSSMQRHPSHLKVLQMGCGFFRSISYEFANHEYIENVNGVHAIIDAMNKNSKKQIIMEEGCYFLQNILCNPDILPETIRLVVSSKIALTIVDGLSDNINDALYVDAACGVIRNLAINEDARSHVGDYQKSIPSLLSIIGPDTKSDTCTSSMTALTLLATENGTNAAKIVDNGGIQKVIDILQTCHDADLSHQGIRLLVVLSHNDDTIANQLAESGCLNVVTSQMSKHSTLPFIQATCCGILRILPTANEDQAKSITKLVLAAMKMNGEDKTVQFEGCHALLRHCCHLTNLSEQPKSGNLFKEKSNLRPMRRQLRSKSYNQSMRSIPISKTNESSDIYQENTSDEVDIDSIINIKPLKDDSVGKKIRQIVIKALQNPHNSKTQDLACEALRKLATDANHVTKIVYFGGLRMASKAMKDHPDKTIVQAEASALLAQLAWVDPPCVDAIISEGVHHLVLSSMQRHPSHLKVLQMGCGFFRSISYEFANHEYIENVNGVHAIIDAMNKNAKKQIIMKEGCYFLQNILCNPDILQETIRLVVSSKIALTIVDGLSDNINDAEYVDAACGVISNLAINEDASSLIGDYQKSIPSLLSIIGPDTKSATCTSSMNALKLLATGNVTNAAKIVDNGGIHKVIDCLSRLNNDEVTVDACLGLLSALAQDNREISQLLIDSGGVDLIQKATANYSDSPHIQARACEVLPYLLVDGDDIKGAIGFTLSAMKVHKHSLVQYAGCHALLQHCWRFPEYSQLLQSKTARSILMQSQYTPWKDATN